MFCIFQVAISFKPLETTHNGFYAQTPIKPCSSEGETAKNKLLMSMYSNIYSPVFFLVVSSLTAFECSVSVTLLDAGCWMLGSRYWVLGAPLALTSGCWAMDAGYWILDAGCWVLSA